MAHAAELAGGVQALSERLRVPVVDVMRWIQGETRPPMGVFLRVVDFVIQESKKPGFFPPRDKREPGKPAE
jgi:hypothetical protein